MNTFQYEYRVGTEQNKGLIKETDYERWRYSLGPHRTSRRGLVRRLIQQAGEWLERQDRLIQCNKAVPACGLSPIA